MKPDSSSPAGKTQQNPTLCAERDANFIMLTPCLLFGNLAIYSTLHGAADAHPPFGRPPMMPTTLREVLDPAMPWVGRGRFPPQKPAPLWLVQDFVAGREITAQKARCKNKRRKAAYVQRPGGASFVTYLPFSPQRALDPGVSRPSDEAASRGDLQWCAVQAPARAVGWYQQAGSRGGYRATRAMGPSWKGKEKKIFKPSKFQALSRAPVFFLLLRRTSLSSRLPTVW